MSYQIRNKSSTFFSDIPPGTSKTVETLREVQFYQKFIDTGLLSVEEVKKREQVPKSANPPSRDKKASRNLEETETIENG